MEASLSFLGFYSECVEAVAPVPKTGRPERNGRSEAKVTETFNGTPSHGGKGLLAASQEDDDYDGDEPVFGGRYCLANLQLSNSAIKALQVRLYRYTLDTHTLSGLLSQDSKQHVYKTSSYASLYHLIDTF